MQTNIAQRFALVINDLGISKNAFARSIGKTATVIQHLLDGRNKPGFDLLEAFFMTYPNVSKEWMMLGSGPRYLDLLAPPRPVAAEAPSAPAGSNHLPEAAESPVVAAEPEATKPQPALLSAGPDRPAPGTESEPAPASATQHEPSGPPAGWEAALYAQQLSHQLALAEQRNQHLVEQQRLMQQMLELMQRQISN
ncbi:hypothetical protein LJY25_07405 [Hymenobacter sp. BT175]|uniref:hypothetical protein n=1 Tax=Hymenobacter translucens TaxID=2886507 RepID=UPI001D0E5985|nr:hypothetical protein [Hymenobacter translucens]MCC2546267.1 hypothetical protein [Hymenobacter translucens]